MKTIAWLAHEASERFFRLNNRRPVLRLCTTDGALLSPEDLIPVVLMHNEEVSEGHNGYVVRCAPAQVCFSCCACLVCCVPAEVWFTLGVSCAASLPKCVSH